MKTNTGSHTGTESTDKTLKKLPEAKTKKSLGLFCNLDGGWKSKFLWDELNCYFGRPYFS